MSHVNAFMTPQLCVMPAEPVKTESEEGTDSTDSKTKEKRFTSSWDAKAAGSTADSKADYLSNLGQAQEYNINVTHGTAHSLPWLYAMCTDLSLRKPSKAELMRVLQGRTIR